MSYQEKGITVSLMSSLLIFGIYVFRLIQLYQDGAINSANVFSLWGLIIVLAILTNVFSNIITQIVFAIIHAIKTNEEETFIADERDHLIGLKGTRNAYVVFSIGVLFSMGSLVLDMPPLVMFNMLMFSGMVAEIVGDFSRLYLYRRGF